MIYDHSDKVLNCVYILDLRCLHTSEVSYEDKIELQALNLNQNDVYTRLKWAVNITFDWFRNASFIFVQFSLIIFETLDLFSCIFSHNVRYFPFFNFSESRD